MHSYLGKEFGARSDDESYYVNGVVVTSDFPRHPDRGDGQALGDDRSGDGA